MKKLTLLVAGICCFLLNGTAQLTYKDVAPVFYANCTTCHNPNGIGPMPLMNYSQTFAYTKLISSYVTAGLMPPWIPDTTYHRFVGERILNATEKSTILNWIAAGAPAGDTTLAPVPPIYNSSYKLAGKPDLIVKIPTFTSNATTADAYNCFVVATGLPADRIVRGIEVVPGNPAIVHHILLSEDTSGTATSDLSGSCFTMPGSNLYFGAWTPGAAPTVYPGKAPLKMGVRLKAGCNIVLEIHYPIGTAGKVDSTQVRFYFYPPGTTGVREVLDKTFLQNWNLFIPANTVQKFTASSAISSPISLVSTFPHNHKVGVSITNYAYSGIDTIKLIREKNWDFRWQGAYTYPNLVKIPAGYSLYSTHTYDNTTNNPNNPNSPPALVIAGTSTSNEMLFDGFQYLTYQPGDENINIAALLAGDTLLAVNNLSANKIVTSVFPNPFDQHVHIGYTLNNPGTVSILIYNIQGKVVRNLLQNQRIVPGYYETIWDGKSNGGMTLTSGVYFYSITSGKQTSSGKILMMKE